MGGPTFEFSRRERIQNHRQKPSDLVRAAVGWNAMFGAPVAVVRVAGRMRRPQHPRITPAQRALIRTTHSIRPHLAERALNGITRSTRSGCAQRAHRTTGFHTTYCTTGAPHNEPSYHTLHHGHRHDGAGTTGIPEAQFAASTSRKGM